MHNSFANGSTALGGLLPQTFTNKQASSSGNTVNEARARDLEKPSSGSTASTDSADFRATMRDIAQAKAQAKREHQDRLADKRADQLAAARQRQERDLHKPASANEIDHSSRSKSPTAVAKKPTETESTPACDSKPAGELNPPEVHSAEMGAPQTGSPISESVETAAGELPSSSEPGVLASDSETGDGSSRSLDILAGADALTESPVVSPGLDTQAADASDSLTASGIGLPQAGVGPLAMDGKSLMTGAQLAAEAGQVLASDGDEKAKVGLSSDSLKAAGALPAESAGNTEALLSGDAEFVAGEQKNTFAKLMVAAQASREGQVANQDLAASAKTPLLDAKTTEAPALESAARTQDSAASLARGFVVQTGVPHTMGQPRWSEAVGERVLWLAAQNLSSAEIRLDPPELGPMQVRISIQQDQASITFASPHLAVREALDQSAMRLRDMFSEQGLNLVNVDVSDQPMNRHQAGDQSSNKGNSRGGASGVDNEEVKGVTTNLASVRLVDHYA